MLCVRSSTLGNPGVPHNTDVLCGNVRGPLGFHSWGHDKHGPGWSRVDACRPHTLTKGVGSTAGVVQYHGVWYGQEETPVGLTL